MQWLEGHEQSVAIIALVLTLLAKFIHGWIEARRQQRATLRAVVSEVGALCGIVEDQKYLEIVEQALAAPKATPVIVDIRSDYFSVFEAVCQHIGRLEDRHVGAIVQFYVYSKAAQDVLSPDCVFNKPGASEEQVRGNNRAAADLLRKMLRCGNKVRAFVEARPAAPRLGPHPQSSARPPAAGRARLTPAA